MNVERPNSSNTPPRVSFLTRLIATGLFSGYIPWAPGTFGSLVGILAYLIPGAEQPGVLLPMIIIGFAVGTVAAGKIAAVEGNLLSRSAEYAKGLFQPGATHAPDPSIVVIDEVVGMWIALLWLPKSLITIALAFVAFRVLDILKPEPAQMMERLPHGLGIMLDDVIAGIYANLTTNVLYYILTLTVHGV
jgi:phosphatidylglycerophosphatase A